MDRQLVIRNNNEPSTSGIQQDNIPAEIRNSFSFIRKRFQFNIDQIEKRYCSNSSGLVFNLKDDNVEFDPEECTAKNDEDLLNSVKKELHKHTLDTYGGSALLSTPAQDPDEKDQTTVERWEKLNKLYDVYLNAPSNNENKAIVKRKVTFAVPDRLPLKPLECRPAYNSAYTSNRINFTQPLKQAPPNYIDALFSRPIQTEGSIAESHAIEETQVLPLMPTFQMPRQINQNYEPRITRSKAKMLAIESNYNHRKDTIYAENSDWVQRWVDNSFSED